MQARWGIGARPRDVSGLLAQGLLDAAAVCLLVLYGVDKGGGCWRLMGTTRGLLLRPQVAPAFLQIMNLLLKQKSLSLTGQEAFLIGAVPGLDGASLGLGDDFEVRRLGDG